MIPASFFTFLQCHQCPHSTATHAEGREAGRLGESVSKGHLLRMWAVNTSILLLSAFVLFHYHLPEWPRYVVNTFGLMGASRFVRFA